MDAYSDFAIGQLTTGPSAVATTLTLQAGQGARFPVEPFDLTVWDSGNFSNGADAYYAGKAERMRCTAKATDSLTVTRAQAGTSAVNFTGLTVTIIAPITSRALQEINLSLNASGSGSPEGVVDGNRARQYYDLTELRWYVKTSTAGTTTGWL